MHVKVMHDVTRRDSGGSDPRASRVWLLPVSAATREPSDALGDDLVGQSGPA